MKTRKIPLRKCVACQQMMPKKQLLRIVKTPDDQISIEPKGKMSGRGAYLCGQINCFKLAKKSKALDRALKHSIPTEVYEQLEDQFWGIEHDTNSSKEVIKTD